MNNFFKKIFLIGFSIFFFVQLAFIIIISYKNYNKYVSQYNIFLRTELELASYKLNSQKYKISFLKKSDKYKLLFFYKTNKEIFMLFKIPFSENYYLKISLPISQYNKNLKNIQKRVFQEFLLYLVVITIFSIIFTFILILPIRRAYKINEIFIKDILHDFNTPLSSIKINLYLLKKIADNKYVHNIDLSIKNILNLEQNLKIYLLRKKLTPSCFLLDTIIEDRISFYQEMYPNIKIINHIKNIELFTDKFSFERIVDNILSNAFKYNKKNGLVHISYKKGYLIIKDSGVGIKNPSQIFNKFYKEQTRGLGIGLNIVYNFAKMLKIKIYVHSKINKGSTIFLKLKNEKNNNFSC